MAPKKNPTETVEAEQPVSYSRLDHEIHIDNLTPSPLNPRQIRPADHDTKIAELASSIARLGVLDRLIVRESKQAVGVYEVLAGGSRYEASAIAGRTMPERLVIPCVVVDVPDDIAFEIATVSNDQRSALHPLDECRAFVRLRDEYGRSVKQIAAKVGRTEMHVYERLRLEGLTPASREDFAAHRLSLGVAEVIARVADAAAQDKLRQQLHEHFPEGIPISEAKHATKLRLLVLKDAPFDVKSTTLVPAAGKCTVCPKRSLAQRELFADLLDDGARDKSDRCLDIGCWQSKVEASWEITAKAAADEGKKVASPEESEKIIDVRWGGIKTGYSSLDSECWEGNGNGKPWRDVLKAKLEEIEVQVVRGPRGEALEVAKTKDLVNALGGKKGKKIDTRADADRNRLEVEVRRRSRTEWIDRVCDAVDRGAANRSIDFWRAFLTMWTAFIDVDISDAVAIRVVSRHAVVGGDGDGGGEAAQATLRVLASTLNDDKKIFAAALTIILEHQIPDWHGSTDIAPEVADLGKALGVNGKIVAKETAKAINAEQKAKEREKKLPKPAKRRAVVEDDDAVVDDGEDW